MESSSPKSSYSSLNTTAGDSHLSPGTAAIACNEDLQRLFNLKIGREEKIKNERGSTSTATTDKLHRGDPLIWVRLAHATINIAKDIRGIAVKVCETFKKPKDDQK